MPRLWAGPVSAPSRRASSHSVSFVQWRLQSRQSSLEPYLGLPYLSLATRGPRVLALPLPPRCALLALTDARETTFDRRAYPGFLAGRTVLRNSGESISGMCSVMYRIAPARKRKLTRTKTLATSAGKHCHCSPLLPSPSRTRWVALSSALRRAGMPCTSGNERR